MAKQIRFLSLLAIALFLIIIPQTTSADDPNYFLLSGWAWSSNIGWVNFGNFVCDPPPCPPNLQYGVKISKQTGDFEGYAWSSSVGWVSFEPGSGYPEAPFHRAKIAVSNEEIPDGAVVEGWARACSVFVSGCEGNLKPDSQRGGWNGWAKLSGTTAPPDNKPYGVKKVTDNEEQKEKLVGLSWPDEPETLGAWAGDNIGWLSFYEVLFGPGGEPPEPPPLSAECSAEGAGEGPYYPGDLIDWTISVDPDSPGTPPYTYCWGGEDGGEPGCSEFLGGDVHWVPTTLPEDTYTITYPTNGFPDEGLKTGWGRVVDNDNNFDECYATIEITAPGEEPPDVSLLVNGQESVIVASTTSLYLTWSVVDDNATSCVGESGFGDWNGQSFDYPDVKKYDIIPPPNHPLGDYTFEITCSNNFGDGSDSVDVNVINGDGEEDCLEISGSSIVKITQQPLGTPAISTVARVKNNCGQPVNACVEDVTSIPHSDRSLAKPNPPYPEGILTGDPPLEMLPTCWLQPSDVPIPFDLDDITTKCYNSGNQACANNLGSGQEAKAAIVIQRPLELVSLFHPYKIKIYNTNKPDTDWVNVIFEYWVTEFEER